MFQSRMSKFLNQHPVGMHRSVENAVPLIQHPVRDASLGSHTAFGRGYRYVGLFLILCARSAGMFHTRKRRNCVTYLDGRARPGCPKLAQVLGVYGIDGSAHFG